MVDAVVISFDGFIHDPSQVIFLPKFGVGFFKFDLSLDGSLVNLSAIFV